MAKHERKHCPECGVPFECKVGSITICQCWSVTMSDDERQFVQEKFDNCLCASCMMREKRLYHELEFKKKLKKIGIQSDDRP